jgi:HEAT repeat protein
MPPLLTVLAVLAGPARLASAERLSDKELAALEEETLFAEGGERDELVKRLAKLEDRRTQNTLAKLLLADPPLKVELQDLVFAALNKVADKEILPDVERMTRSPSPAVQHYGLKLLGRMRDERAVDLLIAASRSRTATAEMLVSTVRSLGQNGHPKAIPCLKKLAEERPELAEEATIARFQAGDPEAFGPFFDLYQAKADTLTNTAWEYGFRTGKPAEVKRLKKEKDELEDTLRRMEQALQEMPSESVPALISHVRAKGDARILNLLFCSLPGLVRAENAESFLPLLDCPSPEVVQMAIRRMDKVGSLELKQRIDARLLELLRGGDVYLRRLVLENADRFGEEKGWEVLQLGLKDESPWVRQKAQDEARKWKTRKQEK